MDSIRHNDRYSQGYVAVTGNPEVTHLKVAVSYNKGGMNMWTYKDEARGYYLSVTPIKRESQDGYCTETTTLFSGYKCFIHGATRFSSKVLQEHFATVVENYNKGEGAVSQMLAKLQTEKQVAI